jgi:hypothetical protein
MLIFRSIAGVALDVGLGAGGGIGAWSRVLVGRRRGVVLRRPHEETEEDKKEGGNEESHCGQSV